MDLYLSTEASTKAARFVMIAQCVFIRRRRHCVGGRATFVVWKTTRLFLALQADISSRG